MGSETIVKFNVIETSLKYKSSTQNNPNIKETSYSSHLKPKHPTHNNPQEHDTELGIFDAQKYFSETNETKDTAKTQHHHQLFRHDSSFSIPRLSTINEYGGNFRPSRSFRATPTASSKASWNSKTGLLSNPPGSIEVSLNSDKKRNSIAKKWFFARKFCCSGKKSVQVEKVASEIKHNLYKEKKPQILSQKSSISNEIIEENQNKAIISQSSSSLSTENKLSQRVSASGRPFIDGTIGFSFPILKPCPNQAIKKGVVNIANPIINPIRDSLDSFNPGSPNTARDEDMGSDASSDLFEIESFSAPTTLYPVRDSLDDDPRKLASAINGVIGIRYERRSPEEMETETPSGAATECYPPSEVSIDWSVATAEGFSVSTASDTRDVAILMKRMEEEATGGDNKSNVNRLILMGCGEEKPMAVKCVAEGPTVFPLIVGGRPPRVANTTAPPGNSESMRLSLTFAA